MRFNSTYITPLFCALALLVSMGLRAQKEKSLLREGNGAYESNDLASATLRYQEALSIAPSYGKASYNLGSSLYRLQQLGEAAKQYEIAAADAIDKGSKSDAFHNLGNCFLNTAIALKANPVPPSDTTDTPDPQQLLGASIEAYKKALRLDPKDEETRYNLAYAQRLLDKEGGGGGQEQQQDEKKEGDKGDQSKENPKDEGDKQDQQKQEPKNGEMSKEEAERMLNALDQQEKDLQEEMGKQRMQEGKPIKIEKDW
ncbi:MAG: tetratricopeptide repeat protein [Bacteroidetes bacterium]|nr:tetratricopeptide repeat protein [Bacteroidota bacterium]